MWSPFGRHRGPSSAPTLRRQPRHRLSVSDDYTPEASEFTGTIDLVRIAIAQDAPNFSHLVDPQLQLSVALARQ